MNDILIVLATVSHKLRCRWLDIQPICGNARAQHQIVCLWNQCGLGRGVRLVTTFLGLL